MNTTTVIQKPAVTLRFASSELTGTLVHDRVNGTLDLLTDEGTEHLSVNLEQEGLVASPGCLFIKDWSEHTGLSKHMADAGLVEIDGSVTVGPFSSLAYAVYPTLD